MFIEKLSKNFDTNEPFLLKKSYLYLMNIRELRFSVILIKQKIIWN